MLVLANLVQPGVNQTPIREIAPPVHGQEERVGIAEERQAVTILLLATNVIESVKKVSVVLALKTAQLIISTVETTDAKMELFATVVDVFNYFNHIKSPFPRGFFCIYKLFLSISSAVSIPTYFQAYHFFCFLSIPFTSKN